MLYSLASKLHDLRDVQFTDSWAYCAKPPELGLTALCIINTMYARSTNKNPQVLQGCGLNALSSKVDAELPIDAVEAQIVEYELALHEGMAIVWATGKGRSKENIARTPVLN